MILVFFIIGPTLSVVSLSVSCFMDLSISLYDIYLYIYILKRKKKMWSSLDQYWLVQWEYLFKRFEIHWTKPKGWSILMKINILPLLCPVRRGNRRNQTSPPLLGEEKKKIKDGNSRMGSEMLMQKMGCCYTSLRPDVKTNFVVT